MNVLAVVGDGVCFSAEAESALRQAGFEILRLPGAGYLSPPVSRHADMLMLPVKGRIFCHERYLCHEGREAFAALHRLRPELEIFPVADVTGAEYPLDVRLNCALVGGYLFSSRHTSSSVIGYAIAEGITPVTVKQGYTGCSVAAVGESGLITSDRGIAAAGRSLGLKVLEIAPGNISLPGYDAGFIGGCTGTFGDKVYFCGDLSLHPEGEKISGFCHDLGYSPVSLCGGRLTDVGSIFFI